jgi:hypothetical protein
VIAFRNGEVVLNCDGCHEVIRVVSYEAADAGRYGVRGDETHFHDGDCEERYSPPADRRGG